MINRQQNNIDFISESVGVINQQHFGMNQELSMI